MLTHAHQPRTAGQAQERLDSEKVRRRRVEEIETLLGGGRGVATEHGINASVGGSCRSSLRTKVTICSNDHFLASSSHRRWLHSRLAATRTGAAHCAHGALRCSGFGIKGKRFFSQTFFSLRLQDVLLQSARALRRLPRALVVV